MSFYRRAYGMVRVNGVKVGPFEVRLVRRQVDRNVFVWWRGEERVKLFLPRVDCQG